MMMDGVKNIGKFSRCRRFFSIVAGCICLNGAWAAPDPIPGKSVLKVTLDTGKTYEGPLQNPKAVSREDLKKCLDISLWNNIIGVEISGGVIYIRGFAFSALNLTQITLPDSIESIGVCAFSCCTKLSQIELPNVKSIGEEAFFRCIKLTQVSLPNVESIGENAFSCCIRLMKIKMPENTQVAKNAFIGCLSLVEIPDGIRSVILPNNRQSKIRFMVELPKEPQAQPMYEPVKGDFSRNGKTMIPNKSCLLYLGGASADRLRKELNDNGYKIVNVTSDGNCGFYAILQSVYPDENYCGIEREDWQREQARQLRELMFSGEGFIDQLNESMKERAKGVAAETLKTLSCMAKSVFERQYYLPFDSSLYCNLIYLASRYFDRSGVIIVNGNYTPGTNAKNSQNAEADVIEDPYNHPYLVPNNSSEGHEAYGRLQDALAKAGDNPIILYYMGAHWQAVLKRDEVSMPPEENSSVVRSSKSKPRSESEIYSFPELQRKSAEKSVKKIFHDPTDDEFDSLEEGRLF